MHRFGRIRYDFDPTRTRGRDRLLAMVDQGSACSWEYNYAFTEGFIYILQIVSEKPSRSSAAPSRDHETEMFRHRCKVAIVVQQRVTVLDAVRADDDVGCLADRDAEFPQLAIVTGGAGGQIGIQKRHYRILAQSAFDARGMGLVSRTLENLEQYEIADEERFSTGDGFQLGGCRCSIAAQVCYPYRAVDENHDRRRAGWP